jgi:hypothetical protein
LEGKEPQGAGGVAQTLIPQKKRKKERERERERESEPHGWSIWTPPNTLPAFSSELMLNARAVWNRWSKSKVEASKELSRDFR